MCRIVTMYQYNIQICSSFEIMEITFSPETSIIGYGRKYLMIQPIIPHISYRPNVLIIRSLIKFLD